MAKKKEEPKEKKPAAKKKAAPKKKNPGGRPEREFDQKVFENLCKVQCTTDEIEAVLNCDQRTLDKWCKRTYGESYSTVKAKKGEDGKSSLRRAQFRQALTNPTMAIWLGKNWLGQKDKHEIDGQAEVYLVHSALPKEEANESD